MFLPIILYSFSEKFVANIVKKNERSVKSNMENAVCVKIGCLARRVEDIVRCHKCGRAGPQGPNLSK